MSTMVREDQRASRSLEADEAITAPVKRRLVHVRELDGVRGLAALAVFFHHVCFASLSSQMQGWGPGVRFLAAISRPGAAGVDLFFVLSGFLITSLLVEDRDNRTYYPPFYWKRALRILPLYLVCLLGVLAFAPQSGGYVLLSTLFIANFAGLFHVASSGPFWTLAIEEQFYLIWPTVVRRRSIESISRWAVVIGLGAVVLRLGAASFGHYNYYLTFFRCDGLALGAWFACRFERWGRLGLQSRREKIAWATAITAAIALLAASTRLHGSLVRQALGGAFYQTAITLLCGSLVAFLLVHRGKPFLSLFRSRLLTFFGLISYALYMTHMYVLEVYDHLRGAMPTGDLAAYGVRLLVVLGMTVAICLISRYVLELPAISLRRFVLKPEPAPARTKLPAEGWRVRKRVA